MSEQVNPIQGPFDAMPAKTPGTIVVAVGSKGAVEIRDGERLTWGERVFGNYKTFYLVDVSPKTITEQFKIASQRATLSFVATVTYDIRVKNPREIINDGITNLQNLLSTAIKRGLSTVGKDYNVTDIAVAQQAMLGELEKLDVPSSVKLLNVSVELVADEAAQELLRKVHEEELKKSAIGAQGRVEAFARGDMKKILESEQELLAQLLVTKDNAYDIVLQRKIEQAKDENERRLVIMKAALEKGLIEAHDFHQRFPDFLGEVFRSLPGRSSVTQPPALPDNSNPTDEKKRDPA